MADEDKNQAAADLGRLGGKKTAERGPEYYAKIQAMRETKAGGRPKLPRATHAGPLRIADIQFECAVLDDGRRVVSETNFMEAMGMYRSGAVSVRRKDAGAPIPLFLAHKNLKPFAEKHLGGVHFELVDYRSQRGQQARGIPAGILPKVCEVWMDANKAGVLGSRQRIIAEKAEVLFRGLAHVGIIALIDEATGYQQDRARDDLNRILEAYISAELLPWTKRFPNEFFKQLYRLNGWNYVEGNHKRPRYVGSMINTLVYEHLPHGVLPELKLINPPSDGGRRKHTHHQFLTPETGHPHLDKQIIEVTTLMRVSDDKETFRKLFGKAFPKKRGSADQLTLAGMDEPK